MLKKQDFRSPSIRVVEMNIVVYASILEGHEKAEQVAKTIALLLKDITEEPISYHVIVIPSVTKEHLTIPSVFINGRMVSASLDVSEVIDKYLKTILVDYVNYPITLVGQSSVSLNMI